MAEFSSSNVPTYSAEIRRNSAGEIELAKCNEFMCLPRNICEKSPKTPMVWQSHEHNVTGTDLVLIEVETEKHAGSSATIGDWLQKWRDFEFAISPLAHWVLHHWPVDKHEAHWPKGEIHNEAIPGFTQIPLLSPTLPPAKHTNAYLVGDDSFVVVDPATYEDTERAKLRRLIDARLESGAQLSAIVLTHHHADHYGAAQWLKGHYNRPIVAHPVTRDLLRDRVPIEKTLDEGDCIDLGKDRFGRPFGLEVYFTPGHAPGHIVLADLRPKSKAMVVGDMVAAVGTIIVDPDEGDMSDYMNQLKRLKQMYPSCLFPAHGPPIPNGPKKLQQYLRHRQAREDLVLSAVEYLSPANLETIVSDAYRDTPKQLHPLAQRSCLAHLNKLKKEGKISMQSDVYIKKDEKYA
ncbi:MAG: MBL fold metallo-hydrolase [Myxococcota bacterium]|nr:MBL fold metallo-hydrolase [Myxococcota bacterium]